MLIGNQELQYLSETIRRCDEDLQNVAAQLPKAIPDSMPGGVAELDMLRASISEDVIRLRLTVDMITSHLLPSRLTKIQLPRGHTKTS
jgi:hypothetical protein